MRPDVGATRSLRVSWRKPMPSRLVAPGSPPPVRHGTSTPGNAWLEHFCSTLAPAATSRKIMLAALISRLSSIWRSVQPYRMKPRVVPASSRACESTTSTPVCSCVKSSYSSESAESWVLRPQFVSKKYGQAKFRKKRSLVPPMSAPIAGRVAAPEQVVCGERARDHEAVRDEKPAPKESEPGGLLDHLHVEVELVADSPSAWPRTSPPRRSRDGGRGSRFDRSSARAE